MSNLYRPYITRYIDPATGKRVNKSHPGAKKVQVRAKKWYVKIKNTAGKWEAVPLSPKKEAAAVLSGKAHDKAALANAGIVDRYEEYRLMPLARHLEGWAESLASKESTDKNVAMKRSMVQRILNHCKFVFLADWSASEIESCLAEFRKLPRFSIQTNNHYLTTAKQFSRWLYRNKRMADDPLLHLQPGNVALDRRHDRREMKDEELRLLLQATAKGPVRCRLPGTDREKLYCVAAYTGLRASELASLTPQSFSLDTNPATLIVEAAYSKRRRQDTLPIHPGLLVRVADWIDDRPAAEKLWPGCWADGHDAGKMLKKDLHAARKTWIEEAPEGPQRDEREDSDFLAHKDATGRYCDFHALRHSFISRLVRSGIAPKVAQSLARHSTITLTMDKYAHLELEEAVEGLARMASIPTEDQNGCQMVAKKLGSDREQARPIKRTQARITGKETLRIAHETRPIENNRDSSNRGKNQSHRWESNPLPSVLQTDPSPTQPHDYQTTCGKCSILVAHGVAKDADLARLIEVWPSLPKAMKQAILALPSLPQHTKQTIIAIIEASKPRKKAG